MKGRAAGGAVYENLDIAIKSREARLDLESTGCYKEPRITTESKEIRDIMAPIEKADTGHYYI